MKKLFFVLPILALATILLAGCSKDSEYIACTPELIAAEFCTMDYTPVCGDDGMTYGNACVACSSQNIDGYKMGECECEEGDETCEVTEVE